MLMNFSHFEEYLNKAYPFETNSVEENVQQALGLGNHLIV